MIEVSIETSMDSCTVLILKEWFPIFYSHKLDTSISWANFMYKHITIFVTEKKQWKKRNGNQDGPLYDTLAWINFRLAPKKYGLGAATFTDTHTAAPLPSESSHLQCYARAFAINRLNKNHIFGRL